MPHRHEPAAPPTCTRPCLTGTTAKPYLNPKSSLGHHEAIAMLARPHHGEGWPELRQATISVAAVANYR